MIARGMEIIDLDPAGYANFLSFAPAISPTAPRAVLWHHEGLALRLTLDGQRIETGAHTVLDARTSAAGLYDRLAGRARQVIVTDYAGYHRLINTLNLSPLPGELKYDYQNRLNRSLGELDCESFAIYPQPGLDRGPLEFHSLSDYLGGMGPDSRHFLLAVFESGQLWFSFVARLRSSLTEMVTSFDHWPEMIRAVDFSAAGLDRVVRTVEDTEGPVASALFIGRADFERLFDNQRHGILPAALIEDGRAFGVSNLPGEMEKALLACAGLFAYVPLFVP